MGADRRHGGASCQGEANSARVLFICTTHDPPPPSPTTPVLLATTTASLPPPSPLHHQPTTVTLTHHSRSFLHHTCPTPTQLPDPLTPPHRHSFTLTPIPPSQVHPSLSHPPFPLRSTLPTPTLPSQAHLSLSRPPFPLTSTPASRPPIPYSLLATSN